MYLIFKLVKPIYKVDLESINSIKLIFQSAALKLIKSCLYNNSYFDLNRVEYFVMQEFEW